MSLLPSYNHSSVNTNDPRLEPQILSLSGHILSLSRGGGSVPLISDCGIAGQVLTSAGEGNPWYWGAGGEAGGISAIKGSNHISVDSSIPTAPVIHFDIQDELDMHGNSISNCKTIVSERAVFDTLVSDKLSIPNISTANIATKQLCTGTIVDKNGSTGSEGDVLMSGLAWVKPPVYVSSVSAGTNIVASGEQFNPILSLASPLTAPLNIGTQHIIANHHIHLDNPVVVSNGLCVSATGISADNQITIKASDIVLDSKSCVVSSLDTVKINVNELKAKDIHSTGIISDSITAQSIVTDSIKNNSGAELHFNKTYESDSLITTIDKPTHAGETAFLVNKGIPLANKIKHISDDAAYCACSYNNAIYVGCHSNVYKIVGTSIVMRFIVEGTVKVMSIHNKELWIGGSFSNIATVKASNIAIIGNDDKVRPVCDTIFKTEGLNGEVMSFCSSSAGMYIGGVFTSSASGLLPMPLHNVTLFETTGFNTVLPMMCIAKQPVAELSIEGNYLFVGSELKYDTLSQIAEPSAKQCVKPLFSAGSYPISSSTAAVIQSLELYIIADSVKGIDIYTHTDATTFVSDNLSIALPQTGSTCTLKASKDLTRWWVQSLYL